jgi:hypothetical protein
MTVVVLLRNIVNEMDVMSDAFHAYLNKVTGELVTITDEEIEAIENEDDWSEYPGWQRESLATAKKILDSTDYLRLPSKFEIDEYEIMERFCYAIEDPKLSSKLIIQIKGSGAFRRFKDAIRYYGIEDEWYRYRDQALEEIAIAWLESHEIPFTKTGSAGYEDKV